MRVLSRRSVAGLAGLSFLLLAPPAIAQDAHPQERRGFWIGFGTGYGSLGCEGCVGREGALSGNFRLGGSVSQNVLLGVESNGWYKPEGGVGLAVGNTSAVVTLYPSATGGFHLKSGLGLAWAALIDDGVEDVDTGVGGLLGVGYDFRVGRNFSLTPYVNGLMSNFDGGWVNLVQVGLALSWH